MMAKTYQAFAVFNLLIVESHVSEFAGKIDVACLPVMLGWLLPDIDLPDTYLTTKQNRLRSRFFIDGSMKYVFFYNTFHSNSLL